MRFLPLLLIAAVSAEPPRRPDSPSNSVIAHEWGTFTSVTSPDGNASVWRPFFGPEDLPSFVERLQNCATPKAGFGLIRMETPVVYFYAKEPTTASIRVAFPAGLITEWYPRATSVNPAGRLANGRIEWNNVRIDPTATPSLPQEAKPNHYYAARATDAAPVQVNGQWEKLLFYRGVANFQPPFTAKLANGARELNLSRQMTGLWFENRAGKIRIAPIGGTKVTMPATSPGDPRQLLEAMLIAEGLYPKEARAMIETWKDAWFEEGSRVMYIVPSDFVDKELPIEIQPAPAELRRVFVGRMELLPDWTAESLRTAIDRDDPVAFAKYARFFDVLVNTNPQLLRGRSYGPNLKALFNQTGACR